MAKNNKKRRRDTTDITSQRLPSLNQTFQNLLQSPLSLYEDRRTFNPEGDLAPARSFNQSRHRLIYPNSQPNVNKNRTPSNTRTIKYPSASIAFDNPDKVLICARRKIRKEVLHALKKSGKTGQRRPRYNYYSKISCKG